MTQRIHAQAGDEIEILLAFSVVEEHALAAFEGDRITVIGLEKVAALEVSNLFEVCHGKQDFTRVGCGRGNSRGRCVRYCINTKFNIEIRNRRETFQKLYWIVR